MLMVNDSKKLHICGRAECFAVVELALLQGEEIGFGWAVAESLIHARQIPRPTSRHYETFKHKR